MVLTRSQVRNNMQGKMYRIRMFSNKLLLKKRLTHLRHVIRMETGNTLMYDIDYLKRSNYHSRDKDIRFQEKGHIYYVKGRTGFTSVTKFVHGFSKPFDADAVIAKMLESGKNKKYEGMSADQIKALWNKNGLESRTMGTAMHFAIECYYNKVGKDSKKDGCLWDGLNKECDQFEEFKMFARNKGLTPYRSEWCVFHEELKITGCVDMVFKNADGGYDIYDWKRTKDIKKNGFNMFEHKALCAIPDSNYWQYSLQLNMYKFILESKYGLRIDNLRLVSFHPDQEKCIIHQVPNMNDVIIELLEIEKMM